MENWLRKFQKRIEEVKKGEIKFAMDIWKLNVETEKLRKGVKIVGGNSFPYLDLNMNFNEEDELNFSVYWKPDYKTRYMNSGIKHMESCLKIIHTRLSIRLSGLTTKSKANENNNL